jgi:predicted RND superfamily exporter protein
MMMTGSIALGIAVDGTFHFLVRYQEQFAKTADSQRSARAALMFTGPPILQAAVIASVGMLALTLSSFNPTARFGMLMSTMLMAALIGDLVLLPCLLSLRPKTRRNRQLRPHFDRPYRRHSRPRRASVVAQRR